MKPWHPASGWLSQLPNLLSAARIAGMPLLMFVALSGRRDLYLLLLIASQFTDFLDGYLARKLKAQSALGARLDIIGDGCNYAVGLVGLHAFFPEYMTGAQAGLIGLFAVGYLLRFVYARARLGVWIHPVSHVSGKVNFYAQSLLVIGLYSHSSWAPLLFPLAFVTGLTESWFCLRGVARAGAEDPSGTTSASAIQAPASAAFMVARPLGLQRASLVQTTQAVRATPRFAASAEGKRPPTC